MPHAIDAAAPLPSGPVTADAIDQAAEHARRSRDRLDLIRRHTERLIREATARLNQAADAPGSG